MTLPMPNQKTVSAYLSSHLSGADVAPVLRASLRGRDVEESINTVAMAASAGDNSLRPSQLALIVRYLLENESGTQVRDRGLTIDELAAVCEMAASIITSPDLAFGVKVSDSS